MESNVAILPEKKVLKPCGADLPDNDRIISFDKTSSILRHSGKVNNLQNEKFADFINNTIVKASSGMKKAIELAEIVATSYDTTALLEGETGTGKEVLAKVIHYASSRNRGPFIKINCGAISKDLFESELFGYGRGAFTGSLPKGQRGKCEMADGGTLFLDEISELEPSAQVKFLRFLEDREFYPVGDTRIRKVDVRVVAASNKPLEKCVQDACFRSDLYYRLNVAKIIIPPLRERKNDILPLAYLFIKEFNKNFNKNFKDIAPEAEEVFLCNPWKGNVREIKNTIERIILMENDQSIKSCHLSFIDSGKLEKTPENARSMAMPSDGIDLNEVNKNLIIRALSITGGNKAEAARMLNISRPTLVYRIKKYRIEENSL